MRFCYSLFVFCLVALLFPIAQAQTVEENNALVFYFDEGATSRSWYGTGEVTTYLIAGPMIDFWGQPYEFINSWGANGMQIDPFENVASATLTARGLASPVSFELTEGSMSLGFNLTEPLALSGRTVLAELSLMVISSEPIGLTPCYVNGGSCDVDGVHRWFEVLYDDSSEWVTATAFINGPPPVASTAASWGDLKALFR